MTTAVKQKSEKKIKRKIPKVTLELSLKEERALFQEYKTLFVEGKFTDDDLWEFIRIFLGYEIPRKSYCKGHSSPFDFLADGFFERYPNGGAVAYANRGGGKTLDLGLLHSCNMLLKDGMEWSHFGATDRQSGKCYDYFRETTDSDVFKDQFVKTLMRDAVTINGSKLEILPGTYNAASGPHPISVSFDEIEEVSQWKIIEKVMGCSMSSPLYKSLMIFTSTRDFVGGMMDKMLQRAGRVGYRIYTWCIFDVVEQCPEHRRCRDCPSLTQDRCIDRENPDLDENDEPIGRCKSTEGFYPIEDFIKKSSVVDDDTWTAQYICETPMRSGVVYKTFTRSTHVWQTRLQFNWDRDLYVLADWGYTSPTVFLWVQPDEDQRLWVVREQRWINYETSEICEELLKFAKSTRHDAMNYLPVKHKNSNRRIKLCGDSASPEKIKTVRRMLGWDVIRIRKADMKLKDILIVKRQMALREDGFGGIVFCPSCVGTDEDNLGAIEEFEIYSWKKPTRMHSAKDEPQDIHDHAPDAVIGGVKGIIYLDKADARQIKVGGRLGMYNG